MSYSRGATCKPIVWFWWNLVCNISLAIGWCTASFVDLGQLLISDFHGVPPLDFLLKFMNDPVKIQLKIQRGDPMKIWNWKLSQINETRCASTYGQMDITHQVSSKSHNGFLKTSGGIQAGGILNKPFCQLVQTSPANWFWARQRSKKARLNQVIIVSSYILELSIFHFYFQ